MSFTILSNGLSAPASRTTMNLKRENASGANQEKPLSRKRSALSLPSTFQQRRLGKKLIISPPQRAAALPPDTVEVCQRKDGNCQPNLTAQKALQSDDQVQVVKNAEQLAFLPQGSSKQNALKTGLIIYPGALVDYQAYAVIARKLAERGFSVVILNTPNNMWLKGAEKAQQAIDAFPDVEQWALAGHSLGGILASQFVRKNPDSKVKGIAFWASFPHRSLKNLPLKALFLQANRDNLLGRHIFYDFSKLLPEGSELLEIEGGNHSQFGDYGHQPPDWPATVSKEDQQAILLESTVSLLEDL